MAQNLTTPDRSSGLIESGLETPFHSLHREINSLFDDIFHVRAIGALHTGSQQQHGLILMPSIDVSETDEVMRISADLPGVSESDVDISLVDDILTIRAEKALEKRDEKENYHVVERSYGTFLRSLRLPYSVDTDNIQADFDSGVLTVTLPKCKDKEQSRKIPVRSGRAHAALPLAEQTASAQSKQPVQEHPQGDASQEIK